MPDSLEEIAQQQSIIRNQWLSQRIAVHEAVSFERQFGEGHYLLACHAALLAVLTPELLHFIRLNFLDQKQPYVPEIAEMDFLASPLCRPIDDELFEVEPMVREALLFELEERYGLQRLQELASFLLEYLRKKPQGKRNRSIAQLYEWIAQSYLQPDRVVEELQRLLVESVDLQSDSYQTLSKKIQVARTMELLADPLEHSTLQQEYQSLLYSARVLAYELYGDKEALKTTSLASTTEEPGISLFPPAVQQWLKTIAVTQTGTAHYQNGQAEEEEIVEEEEREMDRLLKRAGWVVRDYRRCDIRAQRGVALRHAPLPFAEGGQSIDHYLLYVDQQAAGIIFVLGDGQTLIGQEKSYMLDMPRLAGERARRNPLPFVYDIHYSGAGARFMSYLDPTPRSRSVFTFHRPETLALWLQQAPDMPANKNDTLRSRLRRMPSVGPDIIPEGLMDAQYDAIQKLEKSLGANRQRALMRIPTGAGKTSTAVNIVHRLLKFAGARRVLYLTDRVTLSDQAYERFTQFTPLDEERNFTELYKVQFLQKDDTFLPDAQVCVTTFGLFYLTFLKTQAEADFIIVSEAQRSMPPLEAQLREVLEESIKRGEPIIRVEPERIQYNPAIPIETFDAIIIDDASPDTLINQKPLLDYFDAFLIGVTSQSDRRITSFFENNLVYTVPIAYAIESPRSVTGTQAVVDSLWRFSSALRDEGLSYSDYLEQLTYLLYLKMTDRRTKYDYRRSQYRRYDFWRELIPHLSVLDGISNYDTISPRYEEALYQLSREPGVIGTIFHNSRNKIRDSAHLRTLIYTIEDNISPRVRPDTLNDIDDIYEGLLEKYGRSRDGAEYFTPRPLIRAIVDAIRPRPEERICDPACGTGGFLVAAYDYISRYSSGREQRRWLSDYTPQGYEIVENVARFCAMNLLLHNIEGGNSHERPVTVTNSLLNSPQKQLLDLDPPQKQFDIVLCHPPFGRGSLSAHNPYRQDFWVRTTNKPLNFLQHTYTLLKPGGRAAIIVPDSVLSEKNVGQRVRKILLEDCDVHTLLRLPSNALYGTRTPANVLFFDKLPAMSRPATKGLWIYDLRTVYERYDYPNYFTRPRVFNRADLDDFVAAYHAENREERRESAHFRAFSYEELLERYNLNLDISW
jgi:type I restriction enzyme M protein